jgi:hypothetical protein
MATKKKKDKMPEVPTAMAPEYKAMTGEDIAKTFREIMGAQQEFFPEQLQNQLDAQLKLYSQMSQLQREQAPQFAATAYDIMQRYMPGFQKRYAQLGRNLSNQLAAGIPPAFKEAYTGLGRRVAEGLRQGYDLGDELTREVQQGIRGAQTARGNYLGPALTAEEAAGTGSAALNLYNQRLAAAQSFLQGRNPTDIRTQITGQMQNFIQGRNPMDVMSGIGGAFMGQQYYPQNTYLDTGLGIQAAGIQSQAQSAYNTALGNYNMQRFEGYDRTLEQFLYNQAGGIQGLMAMRGMGGGGMGGGGGIMGMLGMGAGALGGIASGVAGAGLLGGGATAGIVGGIGAGLAAF